MNLDIRYLIIMWLWGQSNVVLGQELQRFEYQASKMGTTFTLTFYATDSMAARAAAQAAFKRIDVLNAIFSDYEEESEINRLSQSAGTGKRVAVSREMWEVLSLAQMMSKKSKGAFDITIGPLSKLWRRAFRRKVFPEIAAVKAAKKRVNYRYLKLYPKTREVRLKKKGMRLDAGGIAKGYTIDQVFKVLKQHGITRALVNGGGDLYVGQAISDKKNWSIALMQASDTMTIITSLSNMAVASSGSTYRFLEWEGQQYSHIIHPRTGLGVTDVAIIHVTTPTCVLADALASTISLLTPHKRKKFIRKFDNCGLLGVEGRR